MPLLDFKSTPIVIICRDRLEPLQQLLSWLDRAGYTRPVLVDNASTYPPLVEFLSQASEVEIVRLTDNLGHLAPWTAESVQAKLRASGPFVATDCDVVPDESCPFDVVEYLGEILLEYAGIDKVGLGLRIDDLPDAYALKKDVVAWESKFWETEVAPGVFDAEVDTTFALYRRAAVPHRTTRALRTGAPYVARHLSWYVDSANPTLEQRYYREHADTSTSHWDVDGPNAALRTLLQMRADEVATREVVSSSTDSMLASWLEEPALNDERLHTPWADQGWHAWNGMSPELEFCDFAGALMQLLRPKLTVETGVGQGFTTRRLVARMRPDQRLLAFEHDTDTRVQLERLPFFAAPHCSLGRTPSPGTNELSQAGLTVLDSEVPIRLEELDLWAKTARPGAVLLVHDTGNGHEGDTPHRLIHDRIRERGIEGVFLRNPRGSFLGFNTTSKDLSA